MDVFVFGEIGTLKRPDYGSIGYQAVGFETMKQVKYNSSIQRSVYIDYLFVPGGQGLSLGIELSYVFGR